MKTRELSRVKIKGGIASKGEVEVVDGALLVTLDTAPVDEGYGWFQVQDGIPSKGEVEVIDGAVHVEIS